KARAGRGERRRAGDDRYHPQVPRGVDLTDAERPARHVDFECWAEGFGTILGCDYEVAGLRIEGLAVRRRNRDRAVPRRMPLVRAGRRRDTRQVIGATEPCSRLEIGD